LIDATDQEKDVTNLKMMGDKSPFIADAIIANPPSFAHIHVSQTPFTKKLCFSLRAPGREMTRATDTVCGTSALEIAPRLFDSLLQFRFSSS
jgi:hypothetical protein